MGDGKWGQEMKTLAKHNRGQSLVEFAFVIPILLILMVGIMEFSRAWMTKNILTSAAREGARAAAVGEDYVGRANYVLNSANIFTASVDGSFPGYKYGPITVTITYDFPVSVPGFLPGWSAATIWLEGRATMAQEYD